MIVMLFLLSDAVSCSAANLCVIDARTRTNSPNVNMNRRQRKQEQQHTHILLLAFVLGLSSRALNDATKGWSSREPPQFVPKESGVL